MIERVIASGLLATTLVLVGGCGPGSATTNGARGTQQPGVWPAPTNPSRERPPRGWSGLAEARPSAPFPVQAHTVADGRALAVEKQMPLILIFQKRGCYRCEEFVKRHLNDKRVREPFSQSCVVRKYYDDSERRRFAIMSAPLVLFYTFDPADGRLHFADAIKGLREEMLVAKRARDVVAGRNRCQKAVDAAAGGDTEAQFVIDHYYRPYLDSDQAGRLRR